MCLGIPGEIRSIDATDALVPTARVSFGGVVKEICLAYVPEAKVGDYVIVHVGFAITLLDAEEAAKTFEYLEQLGEVQEMMDQGDAQ